MATLNVQKAIALGYSPDEIAKYLASRPGLKIKDVAVQQTAAKAKPNVLASLLPLIGSIGGGIIGAPLGPVGMIAGSGIGGGLGELGSQVIGGEKISGKDILGETVLGAAGGGLGVLLGGATKAARGAKALSKASALKTVPYEDVAIQTLKKGTRNVATKAKEIGGTAASLKGLTAKGKLTSLSAERTAINKLLGDVTASAEMKAIPVSGTGLANTIKAEAGTAVDLTSGVGKTNWKFWAPRISAVTNQSEVGLLNKELLVKMQGASKGQKEVLLAIQKPLAEIFKMRSGTSDIYGRLSQLAGAEDVLKARAAEKTRIPILGIESKPISRLFQGTQEGAGNILQRVAPAVTSQPARIAGGQLGARALLGGGAPPGYEGAGIEPTGVEEYTEPTEQVAAPKLKITAEQVALARLMFPDETADAIEAAYNVMNKKTTASAAEEFIGKALTNIKSLVNQDTLGLGPITGGIESAKIGIAGGTATSPEVVALNQRYQMLKLNILRAYQGARISDADYALADKYVPKITDTDQTARTKLNVLYEILSTAEKPEQTEMTYQTD